MKLLHVPLLMVVSAQSMCITASLNSTRRLVNESRNAFAQFTRTACALNLPYLHFWTQVFRKIEALQPSLSLSIPVNIERLYRENSVPIFFVHLTTKDRLRSRPRSISRCDRLKKLSMTFAGSRVALGLFIVFFISRYLRTIVSISTYITFKPKPIAEKPRYVTENATVVIPTAFKSPGELIQCLRSIMACFPAHIIIVTSHDNVELVKTCCFLNSFWTVKVLGIPRLHKRLQMTRALEEVQTDITIFADDDVFWPPGYLDYLLAIFEDPKVGAGGTRQRARRENDCISCWNFLGICYLERRVWNNVCTNAIDDSLSTLSGRTAAYRTEILTTGHFRQFFLEDSWCGKRLNSDDDKCLTRYVYANGWKIVIQFDPRSVIETTLEDSSKYVDQCLRWARAHWRGNLTVMRDEHYWRSWRYWWGAYVVYIGQFQTPALLVDGVLVLLLWSALEFASEYRLPALVLLGTWILFTKIVKLIPHFYRHPQDLKFLPVAILFSYLHGFINIYALITLHVTSWGSKNLDELEIARAEDEEVIPLLRGAMTKAEQFREPTPGRIMVGDDYFSAMPAVPPANSTMSSALLRTPLRVPVGSGLEAS